MSSVSLNVSGQRALSSTINGPESTSASMPTKSDDNLLINVGNAREIRMILPLNARLERVKIADSEYVRLVLPGVASLSAYVGAPIDDDPENPVSSWPHATVSVGKHITDYYGGAKILEVIHAEVRELIPPTES